jgi:hypothetical protein
MSIRGAICGVSPTNPHETPVSQHGDSYFAMLSSGDLTSWPSEQCVPNNLDDEEIGFRCPCLRGKVHGPLSISRTQNAGTAPDSAVSASATEIVIGARRTKMPSTTPKTRLTMPMAPIAIGRLATAVPPMPP